MRFIYIWLLAYSISLQANQLIFVSQMGNDVSNASKGTPLKTLKKALNKVKSGDTIYLRGGTYPLGIFINNKATKTAPIMIKAYKKERVLFKGNGTCKNNDFRIRGDWIIVQDIEIKNSCNGLLIEKGASHNVIKNVSSHHNHFSGFMITRAAAYNTILNCNAYDNFDKGGSMGDGGNADGFGTGSRIGNGQFIGLGNRFINCKAWHNSDDGYDLWKSGNPVTLINCQAFNNGYAQGDGNGFKLGPNNPKHPNDKHVVLSSKAWDNKQNGFDYNDNKNALLLCNNVAYNNHINYKLYGKAKHIMIENISINTKKSNKLSSNILDIFNNWNAKQPFVKKNAAINPTIVIIGDSTVANYSYKSDKGGWGEFLGGYLPNAKIINYAKSGKSSKTFYLDGLWDKSIETLKRNMILLIQFGHNDSHVNSKEGTTLNEYTAFLTHYIHEAKKKGAYPVLVTPMHRLKFDENGHLKQYLQKYERTMLSLANTENIPCINLYAYSEKIFEALGEKATSVFSPNKVDRTHFSKTGAAILAAYIAQSILQMY